MGSGGGMRGGGGGGGAAVGGSVSPEGIAGMGSLTTAEARAVYEYSGGLYTDIRRVVNMQAPLMETKAAVTRYMSQIDAAIGKGSLARETTLFRRTGVDDLGVTSIGAIKPGQVLTSRYYQSTSASQSATERFRGDIRLTIQAGRGTKAVDVTHATGGSMAGEREVLMPRGTKYRVVSVSRKGDHAHVTVKIVK